MSPCVQGHMYKFRFKSSGKICIDTYFRIKYDMNDTEREATIVSGMKQERVLTLKSAENGPYTRET